MRWGVILSWMFACGGPADPGPVPRDSLYALALSLETSTGAHVGLDVHRGNPTLIALFYASCANVCPMTVATLQQLEQDLPAEQREGLRILLVSVDPARDDPAALTDLRARHGLGPHWTVARASDDQVRELSAALGVKYRALADGEFAHGAQVALVDAEGVVRAKVDLGAQSPDALRAALAEL